MMKQDNSQFFKLFDAEVLHNKQFSDTEPLRKNALQAFAALSLPDRKHEEFRYTSLSSLAKKSNLALIWPDSSLEPEQKDKIHEYVKKHSNDGDLNVVVVDGALVWNLCNLESLKSLGVTIELKKNFATPADEFLDGVAALNQAFFQSGLDIKIPTCKEPGEKATTLNLFHFFAKSGAGLGLRFIVNQVLVGQNSKLDLREYFCSLLEAPSEDFISHATQVNLAQSSCLNHFRMEMLGSSEFSFFPRVEVIQDKDSSCIGFVISDGAKLARSSYVMTQVGEQASSDFFGLGMISTDRKLCLHTKVFHLAKRGKSNQYVKSVVGDTGRFSFLGSIRVEKEARGCDARKLNRNLILSKKAEVDSRPVLEIDTQDVKCSHGSTTAPLNKDELFYLLSRGINIKKARSLLCTGFLSELTSKLEDPLLKDLVNEQILNKNF